MHNNHVRFIDHGVVMIHTPITASARWLAYSFSEPRVSAPSGILNPSMSKNMIVPYACTQAECKHKNLNCDQGITEVCLRNGNRALYILESIIIVGSSSSNTPAENN